MLLSEIIPCLMRRLAGFKREQSQTETDDLEKHSMQRGLIRQCPGKQRCPGFLLFDAESAKAALPGRVQVSLDTYCVVHSTSSADLSRFTASALCAEGELWKITLSLRCSGISIAECGPWHSRQKYAKGSSSTRKQTTCWEESHQSRPRARARLSACVRLAAPSLPSRLLTCFLTVGSSTTRVRAIS